MSPMVSRFLSRIGAATGFTVLSVVLLLTSASPAHSGEDHIYDSTLGPHHDGSDNSCRICHETASGYPKLGYVPPPPLPAGTSPWIKNVSVLCVVCHRWAGVMGAPPMLRHAYDNGAHGFNIGTVYPPDSWLKDRAEAEYYSITDLPYSRSAHKEMECTTCHNIHISMNRPFNQKEDIETLCLECHMGRDNLGRVGAKNVTRIRKEFSTHPTGVTVADLPGNGPRRFGDVDPRLTVTIASMDWKDRWVLGGHLADPISGDSSTTPFTCQTCHVVHGAADRPGEHYPGLLAIWEEENPSTLCLGCHLTEHRNVAFADGREVSHPMLDDSGTNFYPASFTTSKGIPEAWTGEKHFDTGSAPFDPQQKETPFCTSCHDVHGGLPGTSILFGPNPVDDGEGDWCYSCHPKEAFNGYEF